MAYLPLLVSGGTFHPANRFVDVEFQEKVYGKMLLRNWKMEESKTRLEHIYSASSSMPSVREKNRYRLLMAKLCLKDGRPDMARPITEELYALIDKLEAGRLGISHVDCGSTRHSL